MGDNIKKSEVNLSLNKMVFFIPWLCLVLMVGVSLTNEKLFVESLNAITKFILDNFTWLFNITTFTCVITVIVVYFSPLGKVKIGGSKAKPMMKYSNLVWITLCTTIAAGILFWACAEPIFHLYSPAKFTHAQPGSAEAAMFSLKTMLLEWTWTPYAVYTVATITFAFAFYNMNQRFSIGSSLVPLFGNVNDKVRQAVDVVCLFALVAGFSASLGTGTLTISGGIERIFGISSNPKLWAIIIAVIVATFVISSVSGVMKGIRILSDINAKTYMILLVFLLIFGPTTFILNFFTEAYGEYIRDFVPMSLYTGTILKDDWTQSWPVFYWCNWLAWTPITAMFLARILKGYTVKQAIRANFVIPALFSTLWMAIFSGSTIYYEMHGVGLKELIDEKGIEAAVYGVFDQMPLSSLIIIFYLFIVFISFVTASDSNTNAIAGLCTKNLSSIEEEAPSWLKIVWGISIGVATWVLISFTGIDGIKAASNLGGFPNMFLVIMMILGLFKICNKPYKYDIFKEDYKIHQLPYTENEEEFHDKG